jgi:hypothetical protein
MVICLLARFKQDSETLRSKYHKFKIVLSRVSSLTVAWCRLTVTGIDVIWAKSVMFISGPMGSIAAYGWMIVNVCW